MTEITLKNGLTLGDNSPCWVVADIGLCHNGNFDLAKEMIRLAVETGVDAVKLQKRDVDNLAIAEVLDADDSRFPSFGNTYRKIRQHIEFDMLQYRELKAYAESLGTLFFASVFDIQSAEQMAELDIPVLKIASHCLSNIPLMERLCKLGIPVLLSTGMAYWDEIDNTVDLLKNHNIPLALYHCVSTYPHTPELANLRMISNLKKKYNIPVGYSSHELDNYSAFLAVAHGAFSVEKHVTLNRKDEGFDHAIALDMKGLNNLTTGIKKVEMTLGTGEKSVSDEEMITREKYHSSIVSAQAMRKGSIISREMLTVKNPGTGIPSSRISSLLGKTVTTDIREDVLITEDMFA